jgi:hypothetical protein
MLDELSISPLDHSDVAMLTDRGKRVGARAISALGHDFLRHLWEGQEEMKITRQGIVKLTQKIRLPRMKW